jgi:GTPase SAR1 family protein
MSESSPNPNQRMNITDASIEGQVGQAGGDLIQVQGKVVNLTVYDRIPKDLEVSKFGIAKQFTQQEYRQRKVLLNKVKEYWIKGVLEKSLHTKALIKLGLEQQLDQVQHPFMEVEEFPEISRQSLSADTSATAVFHQMGEGRTLLILGAPGSGKTIMLLKLAQDLIAQAEEDLSRLIPVVFNLSSWSSERQTLAEWLVKELNSNYQVPKALSKVWVANQELLLLLDGLDEVKPDQREACVETINVFLQTHGQTEIVVCSRLRDYEGLSTQLRLQGAICIQELTLDQIEQYLSQIGQPLQAVKTLLLKNLGLQELLKSPLMLSIVSLAYQNVALEDLPRLDSLHNHQNLFTTYIERMIRHRGIKQQYSRKNMIHWLSYLAQQMSQSSQTVFLIEKMQPSWLGTELSQGFYRVNTALIGGLISILIVILADILIGLISLKLVEHFIPSTYFYPSSNRSLYFWIGALRHGAIMGLIVALVLGLNRGKIETVETLNWSWEKVKSYPGKILNGFSWLIPGLLGWFIGWNKGPMAGLLLGLIVLVTVGLSHWDIKKSHTPSWSWTSFLSEITVLVPGIIGGFIGGITGSFFGIGFGLFFGIIIGTIGSGLSSSELKVKSYPNQGIWKSWTNSCLGAIGAYFFTLISYQLLLTIFVFSTHNSFEPLGQQLFFRLFSQLLRAHDLGVIAALTIGLANGGITCIRHLTLRLVLFCKGYIPWNYARFLDYACDRLFLQKVGGGYIFVHRLLMEHFAAMPIQQHRS